MVVFIGDIASAPTATMTFQEVDFTAIFRAAVQMECLRIDDAARIPEYIARACDRVSGQPGPVVLCCPRTCCATGLKREISHASLPPVQPALLRWPWRR